MLTGVTVSLVLLGYVIVLALELSRLYIRLPWRAPVVIMLASICWLLHAVYLWNLLIAARLSATGVNQLSGSLLAQGMYTTLFSWSLLAALILALAYILLAVRRPTNAIGSFLLPLVLGMILGAVAVRSGQPFDRSEVDGALWRPVHGGALIVGTVALFLGFAAALMNLLQEYRLKTKRPLTKEWRLPSLEYLHTMGRSCLVVSTIAIAMGLVSGVVLNIQRNGSINWLESGIVFCAGLLIWLIVASVLEWEAARRGTSWSAYLNIASFAIVLIALILVFSTPHGRSPIDTVGKTTSSIESHAETFIARNSAVGRSLQ